MTAIDPAKTSRGGGCDDDAVARGLAAWLRLAAMPTFAAMALLTALQGGGPMDLLCSAGHAPQLSGMTPMYLLMSAFHAPAWLKLVSGR